MKIFSFSPLLVACVALAAMFLTACETGITPAAATTASTDTVEAVTTRPVEAYRLGSADKIKVTVFGEPELSGEFVVDGSGVVSLPLIESIQVEGLTVQEFQRLAEERYSDGFLREPRISAEVLNFRPFYILGEVSKPGEYSYSNGLTVLNAVATAEGFTYRANKKYVMIKSADSSQEIRAELTPALKVQPGDTIRVMERFF